MSPLARRQVRQHSGANGSSPNASPEPAPHRPQELSVVVLGVMYPSAVPQPCKVTPDDLQHLPLDLATGRRSTDIIFYDPISSKGCGEMARERPPISPRTVGREAKRRKTPKGGQVNRTEAIEAVVLELAQLSVRHQGSEGWTGTSWRRL